MVTVLVDNCVACFLINSNKLDLLIPLLEWYSVLKGILIVKWYPRVIAVIRHKIVLLFGRHSDRR